MLPQKPFAEDKPYITYHTENRSWQDQWSEEGESDTPLNRFLNIKECSSRGFYETPEFKTIGLDRALENIRDGQPFNSVEPAAWMHDKCGIEAREYNGVMSIQKFHEVHRMKRFDQEGYPDALTRRIHIPNPTSESLGVLVHHVTSSHRQELKEFLLRHIQGHRNKAFVWFDISAAGMTFSMICHFPSFVWKEWSQEEVGARQDRRKKIDGSPWRKSEDLSYLCGTTLPKHQGSIDMLHETQQSLIIMGFDRRMWTLHSLTDSYFYSPNPYNEDTLEHYECDTLEHYGGDTLAEEPETFYDPITLGEHQADLPVDDPREFFFLILQIRLSQALEEWKNINYQLRRHVDMGPERFGELSHTQELTARSARARGEEIEHRHSWCEKTNSLLTRLHGSLSSKIDALKGFMTEPQPDIDLTPRIAASYQKLRRLVKGLEEVRDGIQDVQLCSAYWPL
ncbi:Arginine--tRNA ligase, cytoplasmic-like protein [Purpureocillium lavendulum]|uniref:Arginine--tRNA ligase, cytoplasmic-like protein n=1 Tax=Purpureocillium lavendulum TaxID=1247861 RepID=A0AB34FIS5_9HYPO|nr:Arginine--tRNA ligase, cytoplasmic-like protein [Purpureocillium lavendulum]